MTTCFSFESAPEHLYPGHPEHPDRLAQLQALLPRLQATRLERRAATRQEVLRVHDGRMLDSLLDGCRHDQAVIDPAPTFLRSASVDCALAAAGGAIDCAQSVWQGEANNGFAVVRPPGHHAEPNRPMGFCLLNNVAIAAEAVLAAGARRIAIVDFDAHHGNGTQAAFAMEPRVGFLSMHQWGIYPGTGWLDEAPGARGRIVNVPLPARTGDSSYARMAERIIEPFVRAFRPELMLVSAGFDSHWRDPLTSLGLSSSGFRGFSQDLVRLADEICHGKVVFVLEGGYDAGNLANGAMGVFSALNGQPFEPAGDASPYKEPEIDELVDQIRSLHGFAA